MEQKMSEEAKKKQKEIQRIWNHDKEEISSDLLGSYTGTPAHDDTLYGNDIPVQDQDDL